LVSLLGAAGLLLLTLGVFGAAGTAMRAAWQEIRRTAKSRIEQLEPEVGVPGDVVGGGSDR
jgi:hypothetical protein